MKQIDIDKLLEDTVTAVGENCFIDQEKVDIDQLLEQTKSINKFNQKLLYIQELELMTKNT